MIILHKTAYNNQYSRKEENSSINFFIQQLEGNHADHEYVNLIYNQGIQITKFVILQDGFHDPFLHKIWLKNLYRYKL